MKVLSLFDGISCARVALERTGLPVESYFASEINKYAISISQKNYPDIIQIGDIKDIVKIGIHIDLLIGGSPCQDLSIAKKDRKGLEGERSSLFYDYVRILNMAKPSYFILENVASMPKKDKEIITQELYGIEPVMINAALVSAQNRKRLFWVGKWNGEKYQQVDIPLPEDREILLKDILEQEVNEKYFIKTERKNTFITNRPQDIVNPKASTLLVGGTLPTIRIGEIGKGGTLGTCMSMTAKQGYQVIYNKDGSEKHKSNTIRTSGRGSGINDKHNWDTIRIGQIGKGGQGDRIYSPEGKSVNLSANGGGRGAKTGLYAVANRTWPKNKIEGQPRSKRIEIGQSDKSHALTSVTGDSMVMNNLRIRKLTPVECERLQSLPDNYTEGVSNTQRYKALGNGFNVEVIRHILQNISFQITIKK